MNNTETIPEFGIKRENEEQRDGGCGIVFDPATQLYAVGVQENGRFRLFSGGVEEGEEIQTGVLREVTEESGLHDFLHVEKIAEAITHYHNTLKNVDRVAHATCFIVMLKSADLIPVHHEAHEKFSLHWATADEVIENFELHNKNKDNDHWLYFMEKGLTRIQELGYNQTDTSKIKMV